MKKVSLDTNVLLDRPLEETLKKFEEPTQVDISLTALKELDKFKKGTETINVVCRLNTRFIDELTEQHEEYIRTGMPYNEHLIRIIATEEELDLDLSKNDYRIIKAAKDEGATLLSQDVNARAVARIVGVEAKGFTPDDVNASKLHTGYHKIEITKEEAEEFYSTDKLITGNRRFVSNQFVIMEDPNGREHYGIYSASQKAILPLGSGHRAWGATAKRDKKGNVIKEQDFLLKLLLDPSIEFVTALGASGCGKTYLALAAALEQTLGRKGRYGKIIVMRPLKAIGEDIGYLPGDKIEKLSEWMGSSFDNLEILLEDFEPKDGDIGKAESGLMSKSHENIVWLIQNRIMQLEAITHIRGRSIQNAFIIIDDAQNLTQQQTATIITRAGEGTKVVFLGDISEKQIDDHRLSPSNNGLAYAIDRMKGDDIVGHIKLETVVRSRLAQLGVERL